MSKRTSPPRTPSAPKRRRGAPLGNSNRLTHGLYSRHLSVHIESDVDSMPVDQSVDELALARTRLNDLLELQRRAPPESLLGIETAIWRYINTIIACTHKNAVLGRDQRSSFVTVLEMIRQANDQDGVE